MESNALETLINNSIFFYALLLIAFFLVLILISSLEIKHYSKKNSYVLYKELLASPYAPSISIIAPVFNIENTVIDTVRVLLGLQYNNFDVIIVNDGSIDKSFEKLKDYFQLEAVNYAVNDLLKTQSVHSYYKSKNPAFSKLTVLDKAYGNTGDALNAGLNISEKDLVFCIEQSCFLDSNSLLKLVKPFLEEQKRVIAVGSVVNIANVYDSKNGHLLNVKFPKRLLPGFQVIEYLKSYLIERLAWGHLNGLHVFSSAIGLFDKEIVLASGGFNAKALKPGFDLLVRMRRYMYDNNLEHKVVYNPEPICWVEVPKGLKNLNKQRRNWSFGSLQTLWANKDLLFNSKYGILGLVNFPCLVFSEWITPFFKFLCLIILCAMAFAGVINYEFLGIILIMIYFFAVFLSLTAILFQEKAYGLYSSGRDVLRILILSFIEPIVYHPITIYWKVAASIGKKKNN